MYGTYSVVENDKEKTTLSSADPLYIPEEEGKREREINKDNRERNLNSGV